MKLKQLIEDLNDLYKEYGDLPVWLGVDAGEGWPKLTYCDIHPAFEATLDLDEVNEEVIWEDEEVSEGYILDPLYTDEKRWCLPIIILGSSQTNQEIQYNKNLRTKSKDKQKLEEWAEKNINKHLVPNFNYIIKYTLNSAKEVIIEEDKVVLKFNNINLYKSQEGFSRLLEAYGFETEGNSIIFRLK